MKRRSITDSLLEALSDTPVVLLHGPRQTGKTTLVKWLGKELHPARCLTFDDAGVLGAAQDDPVGFLSGIEGPLILDEVQRVPEIFPAIKAEVDRERRPGRFLLTGSADILLLPRLSESLAGRMEILTLWPFSQGEIGGVSECFVDMMFAGSLPSKIVNQGSKTALFNRVLSGGYPEVLSRAHSKRRRAWFGSYITTILQRDVRDLAHIEGLTDFPRLISLLSTRATSLLNFSELSRSMAMPQSTLKRYMALLETTFLVQLLPAWSTNLSKRLVKSPKPIICDTGLMAYLLGLKNGLSISETALSGPLLENFVVMEMKKQATWSQIQPRLYHFRTHTGDEVDIILEDTSGRVIGLEVKASATVKSRDFRGLKSLADAIGKRFVSGVVLYLGREHVPFGKKLHALPVSSIWSDREKFT